MTRILTRPVRRRAPIDTTVFLTLVVLFVTAICILSIARYVALEDQVAVLCHQTSAAAKLDVSSLAPLCERFTP